MKIASTSIWREGCSWSSTASAATRPVEEPPISRWRWCGRDSNATRDRLAIAIANNEIHRAAVLRPEWNGMACVLTVVVVDDMRAVVGHVGDTRLYKLRNDRIDKITRDHSPIGEREDSKELSELEAMHHPR